MRWLFHMQQRAHSPNLFLPGHFSCIAVKWSQNACFPPRGAPWFSIVLSIRLKLQWIKDGGSNLLDE